jgi:hypothetical protein
MNRYNVFALGETDPEEVIAAKLLITGSGVAIFKDFDGDSFLVLREWDSIELIEKNVEPDEEE